MYLTPPLALLRECKHSFGSMLHLHRHADDGVVHVTTPLLSLFAPAVVLTFFHSHRR